MNENKEAPKSIYQNYRKKIFDPFGKERKMLDEVERGKESAYSFDTSDGIEGIYIKKTSTSLKLLYAFIAIVTAIFFVYIAFQKVNPDAEAHFNSYKSIISDVENMETSISDKRKELQSVVVKLKKTGRAKEFDLSKADDYLLSPAEEKYLSEQISKEKGSEVKNIIQTLISKNEEIKTLREELEEKRKSLRPPVTMKRNLGHEKIAMDFLINEIGLSAKEAREKIENVNIFDYTYDGLYVWNYYENGFYGTFVTKGLSSKSPNQIKKIARSAYESKLNNLKLSEKNLIEEKTSLETSLESSKQEIVKLAEEKEKVAADKQSIASKASALESEVKTRDELIKQMNTLYYSYINLKDGKRQNIISKGFFSGPEITNDESIGYNNSLDLTEERKIILKPEQFKLKEFEKVYILPNDHLKRGSIKLKYDNNQCEVIISRPEYLKEQRILIIAE